MSWSIRPLASALSSFMSALARKPPFECATMATLPVCDEAASARSVSSSSPSARISEMDRRQSYGTAAYPAIVPAELAVARSARKDLYIFPPVTGTSSITSVTMTSGLTLFPAASRYSACTSSSPEGSHLFSPSSYSREPMMPGRNKTLEQHSAGTGGDGGTRERASPSQGANKTSSSESEPLPVPNAPYKMASPVPPGFCNVVGPDESPPQLPTAFRGPLSLL